MKYAKPWISVDDQLAQLEARGLQVSDREKALDYLKRIGYYRLSGYWFAFRARSGPCCALDKPRSNKPQTKGETIALDSFRPGVAAAPAGPFADSA